MHHRKADIQADLEMNRPTRYQITCLMACQRYVCPNVISMTMNVIIQECIIENCFIEPYI